MNLHRGVLCALPVVLLLGCEPSGERPSATRGSATIEVDASIASVIRQEVDDFQRSYTEAKITMRESEAREAVVNFLNDSVRIIVIGRELNKEERDFIGARKGKSDEITLSEWKVALDAVLVIAHKDNPVDKLRIGELDSIYGGSITRWPGAKPPRSIVTVASDVNSSLNEVFRHRVMEERPFGPTVHSLASGAKVLEYVRDDANAIGIVGITDLKGHDEDVSVLSVADPSHVPDSTQVPGQYYSPVQANIYRRYYPITRPVYIYRREIRMDAGYGLISYITSPPGQQIFLRSGLAPQQVPVRLVEITSQQVPKQ